MVAAAVAAALVAYDCRSPSIQGAAGVSRVARACMRRSSWPVVGKGPRHKVGPGVWSAVDVDAEALRIPSAVAAVLHAGVPRRAGRALRAGAPFIVCPRPWRRLGDVGRAGVVTGHVLWRGGVGARVDGEREGADAGGREARTCHPLADGPRLAVGLARGDCGVWVARERADGAPARRHALAGRMPRIVPAARQHALGLREDARRDGAGADGLRGGPIARRAGGTLVVLAATAGHLARARRARVRVPVAVFALARALALDLARFRAAIAGGGTLGQARWATERTFQPVNHARDEKGIEPKLLPNHQCGQTPLATVVM